MRYFLDKRKTAIGDEIGSKITHTYIEIEFPVDDDSSYVIYVIPRNQNSAFVATCWDHTFDKLVSNLDEDTFEMIAETWPTLAALLYNGVKQLYRQGALIVLEDLDDGENKWFVASIAGNISFSSFKDLFNERMQEVTQLVLARTIQLSRELNENQPNMLNAISNGFMKGVGTAVLAGVASFLGIDPPSDA